MLNPFTQENTQVGEAVIGDTWQPLRDLQPLLDLPFGSCPSLVLASSYLEEEDSIALYAEFVRRFSDARGVFDRVRKYPGDPWNRVQEDVGRVFGDLKKGMPRFGVESQEEPLDYDEAVEFASILLSDKHLLPELQAFLFAWKGAIDFQQKSGSGAMAVGAMNLEAFQVWFDAIARLCRWPETT
jgi:hypothetical protein